MGAERSAAAVTDEPTFQCSSLHWRSSAENLTFDYLVYRGNLPRAFSVLVSVPFSKA